MPYIMEEQSYNMDVDDLFGDSEQVAPLTIAAPPLKGLTRRLDELSASGCCLKLTWSKSGCVAYITPDGLSVKLRVFSRDPATGKWDLGKEATLDVPRQDDFQFVHLSWSHLGNDIAVVDAAGHVAILTCTTAMDRMSLMRADVSPSDTEMDAVVGMHWLALLPYEQKNNIVWSAKAKGGNWHFQMANHRFKDAHHPIESKAALVYLRRNGELRLRFQQPDNSWHESGASLGPLVSIRESFTHAAFASNNDDTLLLAAHDISGRLHLYRVETKWNYQPPQPGQPPKPLDRPEVTVTLISIEDQCYPVSAASVTGDLTSSPDSKIRIPAQLTHLNFLPITPEQNDGTLPTIQAIFCTPPNPVSFDQSEQPQNPFSIIVKWEIHHVQQNQLHSSLDNVTSKKKSVSSVPAREAFKCERLPDTMLHAVVLSFMPLWYNMILSFCFSDGMIEFRKRATMQSISPDYNTDMVTTLPQAGFVFSSLDPSLHYTLSPNHCIAACMQQDGSIKLRSAEYTYGSLALDDDDPKHSAALAAIVLQFSSTANQYFSSDDIFAILGELSEKRKRDFVCLMFQGLNVNIDCGIDDSSNNHLILLGRSPFFVKTLSAAHLLGLQGTVHRSLPSKIAWTILNIKYMTQILTTIARMHGQIDKNPLRPEVVPQFIGIGRWIMHFMVYFIDEIMALGYKLRSIPPNEFTAKALESAVTELHKPAILILLSSFPRLMMKLWSQPLNWVMKTAYTYTNSSSNLEIRKIYSPLHQAITEGPLPDWRLLDSLLSEATQLVRACYKRANLSEQARNEAERELILGRVPDVLVPAARRLLTDFLFDEKQQPHGALLDRFDVAKVMFFDTTWLGFQESKHAKAYFDTHIVDVCQKVVLRGTGAQQHPAGNQNGSAATAGRGRSDSVGGGKGGEGGDEKEKRRKSLLRRCVRCGSYMDDVTQGMPGYSMHHVSWLIGVAKHCVCGNAWMLVEENMKGK
ncbi:hypothetical protein BU24DRAFT_109366 [Aaosphaeria arxii CBS 175.79]|uniref:Mediator of RNA polymerase II transcription subunit 16 n=1 Tax=Aaosphaeria arxii CBS 175.79 TaxID=1450172 RepID=A0A6A5Y184_9PLEO|nr:uncharacterized protein BU24DRAFT_109366 [Aaosphaeria arxii CBS 175.79]KAF2018963.1 hypothetical protein BU24DRAFT_109366 [Aaosphaeria arxii CBS 175.79]